MGDPCNNAVISQVKIESVSDTEVTFSTRSESQTGNAHDCLLRSFTVPRAEVYTDAIPGAPPAVALAKGKRGPLYLSRAGWDVRSADGYHIHGKRQALFKLPTCAAATTRLLTHVSVIPTSIMVHGHLEGATEFFDLELLGDEAAPAQAIQWTGADYLDVRLTSRGAQRLCGKPRATTAKIWPIAIRVHGSPAIDQTVSGQVDILDLEMADGLQSLAYARPGQPIQLALTQDGVNAFHLTPQVVFERLGRAGATRRARPRA